MHGRHNQVEVGDTPHANMGIASSHNQRGGEIHYNSRSMAEQTLSQYGNGASNADDQNSIPMSPPSNNIGVITNKPSVDNIGNIEITPNTTSTLVRDYASENVNRVSTDLPMEVNNEGFLMTIEESCDAPPENVSCMSSAKSLVAINKALEYDINITNMENTYLMKSNNTK